MAQQMKGRILTKLAAILDQIDSGSVMLPEFQRGYVWNRDQVRGLMGCGYRLVACGPGRFKLRARPFEAQA